MRKNQYFQKAIVATLASVMIAGTAVPASPVQAATQNSIVVSNERDVLVAGRTYYVKNDNAKNFKSSNETVATVDENGKITPLKTGYVTISATVDGETVKTKFMCVSKFGVTASQKKVDKMLDAENVKNISIVTAKDEDFEIAEGTYTKKVLTVKAPNADVDNYGTFKKIKVKDVAENTFRNYKPNKFVITDKNFRFAEKAKGSVIEVAEGATGRVIAQGQDTEIKTKGNVEVKPHGKNATVAKVEVEGGKLNLNLKQLMNAIKELFIQKKAEVNITGGQKADVKVTVGEDAKGATINSDCSVDLVVNAEITINLTGAAGGSKIDVADGVKVVINVGANVDGNVTVGDTEVKPGDKVEVTEDGKVEVNTDTTTGDTTTGGSTGGNGSTGGGYVDPTPTPPTTTPAAITYTVTFDYDGVSAQTVEENGTATEPTNVTKEGYTLEGWYTDTGFTNKYDFNTPVTGDITLYPNWVKETPGADFEVVAVTGGAITAVTNSAIEANKRTVTVTGSSISSNVVEVIFKIVCADSTYNYRVTEQSGTEQSGTEQSGTEQSGTEQSGTEQSEIATTENEILVIATIGKTYKFEQYTVSNGEEISTGKYIDVIIKLEE